MISVIIPTYQEEHIIAQTIGHVQRLFVRLPVEIIVVDSSPRAETRGIAKQAGASVFVSAKQYRAAQMNRGAQQASGDVFLFLHADTRLPKSAREDVMIFMQKPQYGYGAFLKRFDSSHPFLRLIALVNNMQTTYRQALLGDNGLLVRREMFEAVGGFPDQVLMEDVAMSKRLKTYAHHQKKMFFLLRNTVMTSSRRFETHGIYKTFFLMRYLRLRYAWGTSPAKLKTLYAMK